MPAPLYPFFLKLDQQPVLVVGAGRVASRKIESLLRCGASVTVVARDASPAIETMEQDGRIRLFLRDFSESDLEGVRLVVAATANRGLNERVSQLARQSGIWVNAVDMPELCDFYVPSIVDRHPLTLAISTNGNAPALARRIRHELEERYPQSLSRYVARLGELRESVRARRPDLVQAAGERLAQSTALSLWLEGREAEAENVLLGEIQQVLDNKHS